MSSGRTSFVRLAIGKVAVEEEHGIGFVLDLADLNTKGHAHTRGREDIATRPDLSCHATPTSYLGLKERFSLRCLWRLVTR